MAAAASPLERKRYSALAVGSNDGPRRVASRLRASAPALTGTSPIAAGSYAMIVALVIVLVLAGLLAAWWSVMSSRGVQEWLDEHRGDGTL